MVCSVTPNMQKERRTLIITNNFGRGDSSEGERLHVRVQKKKKHKAAAVI